MERRSVLAAFGLLSCFPGCLSTKPAGSQGSESRTDTEDCWPQFCEGSPLVEVVVNADFSGEVVLDAGCRDAAVTVQPGEREAIVRQSHGETCDVVLTVDAEAAFDRTIQDYESTTLRVSSSGTVSEETEEL